MITYEKALEIARSKKSLINRCDEYEDAYIFDNITGQETMGGSGPVVIMKEDGRAVTMIAYAIHGKHNDIIRSINI